MGKDMSKKERKALEARERELAAELAKREAKAAKKKGKGKGKGKASKLAAANAETLLKVGKSPKAKVTAAADRALATPSSPGAREAAETAAEAAEEATHEETDAEIRARVLAKRKAREQPAKPGPVTEKSAAHKALDRLAGDVPDTDDDIFDDADAPTEPEPTPLKTETVAKVEAAVEAIKAEVTELETERGRVFEAGTAPVDETFAKPSEAPLRWEDDTNGLGQYKVARPDDGKVVGYTRATTYIACLEDRSRLESWKLRILLEGVAINDTPDERGRIPEPVVATVSDLLHRRDVTIAKARKADRKGKLEVGQLATIIDGAWSDFRKALDAVAASLLDVGGAHEGAQKGTDLHALMELADREGIVAVGDLLTDGKITPADLADVEAYLAAIERAGIKIIPELIEQVVVNDELKVGGRLDRVAMVKLPGEQRARRRVVDIKTGQVKPGLLAQQLEMYSSSKGYDPETHERTDLKVDRTKAIVVHVPAGTGTATVHVVDLSLGRKGNALAGQVRAWRNEGKRAVDVKVDIAAPEAA